MGQSRRAPGYDLFKSIVAILLLVLFLILNRPAIPQSPTRISTPSTNPTRLPVSATFLSLTSTAIPLLSPTPTSAGVSTQTPLLSPTPTSVSAPTETSVRVSTQTPLPSPTITKASESTAGSLPTLPATPATSLTSTPIIGTPVASACDFASSRSRLQNRRNAIILRRLNFRSSPGIHENWMRTNIPGTKVQVIGGPECVPHFTGAYVWWQIKLPDGQIGWSAESSQFGSFYFMEPE